jgi:hypothetical protein
MARHVDTIYNADRRMKRRRCLLMRLKMLQVQGGKSGGDLSNPIPGVNIRANPSNEKKPSAVSQ